MRNEDSGAVSRDPAVDPVVSLARAAVEGSVRTGSVIDLPDNVDGDLLVQRAGAFVSLYESGGLRGCIGTIGPTQENLALEIARNGMLAALEDPRFPPVTPDELDYLEYSVDILQTPERISSIDELDVREYGVIVSKDWRRGLLLPNLERVESVEQQIAIAKRKGGIGIDEQGVTLERFKVVRHTRGGEARRAR